MCLNKRYPAEFLNLKLQKLIKSCVTRWPNVVVAYQHPRGFPIQTQTQNMYSSGPKHVGWTIHPKSINMWSEISMWSNFSIMYVKAHDTNFVLQPKIDWNAKKQKFFWTYQQKYHIFCTKKSNKLMLAGIYLRNQ